MPLINETRGLSGMRCECGTWLPLEVLRSAGGYYIGYWCDLCGPQSRETVYFNEEDDARDELEFINNGGTSIYTR